MGLRAAHLVVFTASACTLALELAAARILAPFIGVSLYTWTSIIGVMLAGIAAGNYLGGRIADRWPHRQTLGILLAAGGLATVAVLPLIGVAETLPTRDWIDSSDRVAGIQVDRAAFLVFRIILTTAVAFLPPSLILGMVSPVAMRLVVSDLGSAGGMAGRVYAVSTLGAIVGTFATGFFLVDLIGTRRLVLNAGVVLLLLAALAGSLLQSRRAIALLGLAGLAVALVAPARMITTYQCFDNRWILNRPECFRRAFTDGYGQWLDSGCLDETSYYCIRVVEATQPSPHVIRELLLDRLIHSYNAIDDPTFLRYGYLQVYAEVVDLLAERLPNRDPRILFIGGGGYTLPRHIEATYPNASLEVIEIDPGVTQVAYDKLGVDRRTTRITTYNYDGRQVVDSLLQARAGQYDLVVGDAFNDLSIPYHLATREFAAKVQRLLKPDGYYLALVIDKLQTGKFISAYTRTLQQVWPAVHVLGDTGAWTSDARGTYVVAAGERPLDPATLSQGPGRSPNGETVTRIMPAELVAGMVEQSGAPILTDDYAPVDILIAPIFVDRGF